MYSIIIMSLNMSKKPRNRMRGNKSWGIFWLLFTYDDTSGHSPRGPDYKSTLPPG